MEVNEDIFLINALSDLKNNIDSLLNTTLCQIEENTIKKVTHSNISDLKKLGFISLENYSSKNPVLSEIGNSYYNALKCNDFDVQNLIKRTQIILYRNDELNVYPFWLLLCIIQKNKSLTRKQLLNITMLPIKELNNFNLQNHSKIDYSLEEKARRSLTYIVNFLNNTGLIMEYTNESKEKIITIKKEYLNTSKKEILNNILLKYPCGRDYVDFEIYRKHYESSNIQEKIKFIIKGC